MKRITALLVMISLLLACAAGAAESVMDYDDAVRQMMESFNRKEYQDAAEVYDAICEAWPNPLDRSADLDNFGQYIKGFLAMEKHEYNEASNIFRSLGGFTPEDDRYSAARLQLYCEGQLFTMHGLYEEALDRFTACDGILDSARMIGILTGDRQQTLYGFSASCGSTDAKLTWVNVGADADGYYVNYFPKGVESYAKTILADGQGAMLTGLIPRTAYTVYVTPVKGSSPSGLSMEAEFATVSPQRPDGIRTEETTLYVYSKAARDTYIRKMSQNDETVFLKAVIDIKRRQMMVDNGNVQALEDTLPLPVGDLAFSSKGYIFVGQWYAKKQPGEMIRVVLRSENGEAANLIYYKDVPLSFKAGYFSTGFYLDDLLDELYVNQNGWPVDTDLIVELYIGEMQIGLESFHLTVE